MLNLENILKHLETCRPYGQQRRNPVLVATTALGWILFISGVIVAAEEKFGAFGNPSNLQGESFLRVAQAALAIGATILLILVFVYIGIDIRISIQEAKDGKTMGQRRLANDEAHLDYLLKQSAESLEYAITYLKQMHSRTTDWISHSYGNAVAIIPLFVISLTIFKELGVIGWFQSAIINGHVHNTALVQPIFFVCALVFLAFAAAYALMTQQRRNNYQLGLLEIALKLKTLQSNKASARLVKHKR